MRLLPALTALFLLPVPVISAAQSARRRQIWGIRLCTLRDFEKLCREQRIRIRDRAFKKGLLGKLLPRRTANLFAESAIYLLSR